MFRSSQSLLKGLALIAVFAMLLSANVTAQDRRAQFRNAFQQAVEKDDFSTQEKLVDENKDIAWDSYFVFEKFWAAARRDGNEEQENKWTTTLEYLGSQYRAKHNDKYLSNRRVKMDAAMDAAKAKEFLDAIAFGEKGYEHYSNGAADGNDEAMKGAIENYTKAMRALQKIGDDYLVTTYSDFLGQCWVKSGEHFNGAYFYQIAMKQAQAAGISARVSHINGALAKMREKRQVEFPELINTDLDLAASKKAYDEAVAKRNTIDAGGAGEGEAKGKGKGKGKGKAKDLGTLVSPSTASEYSWEEAKGFKEKAFPKLFTKMKMPYYNFRYAHPKGPKEGPFFQHAAFEKEKPTDSSNFLPGSEITYDGKLLLKLKDQKKGKPMKLKTKFAKQTHKVGYSDGTNRKITNMIVDWYPETLQVFEQKYNDPNAAKYKRVAWYGATGVTGKIRGHDVTILDCNGNGIFRDTGEDAVMIGKGKNARIEPLGRFIMLEDQGGLYPYEFKPNGKSGNLIRTRPFKGSLAPVYVEYSNKAGIKPDFLIIKGSGEDAESYFDIAKAMDAPIWIPPGRYFVHLGYLTIGKGKKQRNILIGRGRSGVLHAESGKLNTWQLGGSGEKGFWMNGKFAEGDKRGEVLVTGMDVEVFGNHGEQYFNFEWDHRVTPLVEIRNDQSKKVLGKKKMRIRDTGNPTEIWFPADVTIKNATGSKRSGRLSYEHPILGKMMSEWIRVN